jgi:hypothetical protein
LEKRLADRFAHAQNGPHGQKMASRSIIYLLEPVSVGGWTKIRLRWITRSSTCVCLRIRNYFLFAARAPHSNFALAAVAAPCSIPVLSRSFSRSALARVGCAAPIARCAHADPHNLCPLFQWVFVPIWGSIGPVLRVPMRYVWCCTHVCARINAHSGSPTPIHSTHCPNDCLFQFGAR